MKPGLFSVVITVFQREWCLPYALQSLAWQSYKNLEILIYSDGPSQKTAAILGSLASHPRLKNIIKYTEVLPRPGYWGNHLRQQGLMEARGEFVSFLSHDTVYHPEFCSVHAARLAMHQCISVTKVDYWRLMPETQQPVYLTVWPLSAPGLAPCGDVDAHCFAYPTDSLREHVKFDNILEQYAADFQIFDQARRHLPVIYDANDKRTLAAHM